MSETIDEITMNYEEDGELLVQELDKVVLTRGAWSTIMFRYQDLDKNTGEFGPVKYSIRRYQKRNGEYGQRSKFNISNTGQALKIIEALNAWTAEDKASEE